jgi:hypothetical protein
LLNYDVLAPDMGVQRRWLDTHPTAADNETPERLALTDDEAITVATQMTAELDRRGQQFQEPPDG